MRLTVPNKMREFIKPFAVALALTAVAADASAQAVDIAANSAAITPTPASYPGSVTFSFDFHVEGGDHQLSSDEFNPDYMSVTLTVSKLNGTGIMPSGPGANFFTWTYNPTIKTYIGKSKTILAPQGVYNITFANLPVTEATMQNQVGFNVNLTPPGGLTNNDPWDDNTSIFTTAPPAPVADLTPTLDINALTFVNAGDTKDFVVNLYEINGVNTDGPISFRITKLSAFNITYSTISGTSNVLGGIVNENSNWTFTENTNFITATANAGITIPANGQAKVGFQISRKPGVAGGNSQNLSPTIVAGSGGENNTTNNQVVTTLMAN